MNLVLKDSPYLQESKQNFDKISLDKYTIYTQLYSVTKQ